ncbi:hypothetical protein C1H76_8194 [Elsinoe australis]|uniref:NADH dehydrogenase [ubiquinone] 1 beta subcomplex subunit 4 n=1 Tax=Elsinoe australis TaxID=40998 RepID=A0A4V6DT82_9PEZI|nr:hypothetical protein C1H76_8194 [Elsinoe australis]
MAGHNKPTLAMDPALVRYANMYVKRHEYFRWNRKTAGLTLLYMAVIPGALYWVARSTEGKYEFRGKRRGDTINEF